MKVNKYIIGMFVATATLFVSCNTDNEGDIYNGTTMGVTFATGTQSVSFPSTGYEGFDVEVLRAKSSEATTINLSATLVVGDKEQELPASITVPSSVSFAAGEFKTNIHVTVGDITPGQNYKVKISLPEEMVTIDQTSDKVITVYRDYTFSSLGTGTFKSAAMAEEGEDFTTWEVEVQKADQISWYKAMNLYEKGYNIVFKVNEANEVTVESQPAWKHASYGEVFVSGKGALEDGVITVKLSHDVPNVGGFGVKDLSLGDSHYAQVRIMVDGAYYLKGMAVYADDLPKGVDIRFNTNKSLGTPMEKVLKPLKRTNTGEIDVDNPFGSLIKEKGGQYYYDDPKGKYVDPKTGKRQSLGATNKRADEGDWGEWADKVPSQFLAKQSESLIKRQLNLSKEDRKLEFDELCSLTNPTIKRKLLEDFADGCDKAAVTLKAAALPRQKYQVILPLTSVKDNEIYAPNYTDGEMVALVRYPHGGTFEIPILKVNNKNAEGKRVMGTNPKDAVGINKAVADRLSGADFDGDTVMVIPTNGKNKIKITSTPELEGLKGFDPKLEYKIPEGNPNHVQLMTKDNTQKQMGVVSNLIMDMTLKGATPPELARAVRHSMVVIDAEKHKLDYKQSEVDNGIAQLKRKYQGHLDANGQYHEGASTLITMAKSDQPVPKRQGSGYVNLPGVKVKGKDAYDLTQPEGKKLYSTADDLYYTTTRVNKRTGEVVTKQKMRQQKSTKMAETNDAYSLVSDYRSRAELTYADYANYLKSMANAARKEMKATGTLKYDAAAKKAYAPEVERLNAALNLAEANKPRERQAQALANTRIKEKMAQDPDLANDKKMLRKVSQQAIVASRNVVGAKRTAIEISDREWQAIQAGAISDNVLCKILDNTDVDKLRARAMPRATTELSAAKKALIRSRAAAGYTNAQIAESLGISPSTVAKYL